MNMMNKLSVILSAIGLMSLMACSSSDEPGGNDAKTVEPAKPIELTAKQAALVDNSNTFALNLLKETMKMERAEDANTVVSPMSVSMALSLLTNGADGETLDELMGLWGLTGKDLTELNTLNRCFLDELPSIDPKTRLSLANSVWINNGTAVLPAYIDDVTTSYDAGIRNLAFGTESARREINSWIEEKTEGMIMDMLQSPPGGILALVNALYFKSVWNVRFEKNLTKKRTFTCADGRVTDVRMMDTGENMVEYSLTEDAAIADIPYGNGAYVMHIVLPNSDKSPESVLENLSPADFSADRRPSHTALRLPSFDLSTSYQLNEVISAMGAPRIFSDADLSKMLDGNAAVGAILHNSRISVNEHGSEAAAATIIEIFGATGDGNKPEPLTVDRPFIFVITENSTGAIIFTGCVKSL